MRAARIVEFTVDCRATRNLYLLKVHINLHNYPFVNYEGLTKGIIFSYPFIWT